MDRQRNIYKDISRYFLNSKNKKLIKNKENPYYISLLQNKKEILETLQEKDINDIEVKISEWEANLHSIKWDEKEVAETIWYTDEKKIPLKNTILEIIEKEGSNELASRIKKYIESASKTTLKKVAEKVRAQIYINTNEINNGIDIISYQKNYIHWDYQKIIKSPESFFEYIEKKYSIYNTISKRLNEKTNNITLKEKIILTIYEDI